MSQHYHKVKINKLFQVKIFLNFSVSCQINVFRTKPILSCCDVINFGIGERKGGRESLQRRLERWGSPLPFPKFMTSLQDNMGSVVFSYIPAKVKC